ncbi:MAG TPA: GntR family transcriptional regulator [Lactobacillus sp.]|nr:GntR family transcriptional regulator [Lactobacillus sp.]
MSRKDEAYEYLRNKIVINDFHPNQVLSENKLTDELNMSRTPVREALKELESDGLVSLSGRETIVAPLTEQDVQEVYELRSLLESYALRQSINLIPEERLAEFEKAFNDAYHAGDWDAYLKVDTAFHALITHLAGHKRLQQFLKILGSQTERTRHVNSNNPNRMERSINEHMEIIKWIRLRNLDEAEKALAYHLQQVYESVRSYLNYVN